MHQRCIVDQRGYLFLKLFYSDPIFIWRFSTHFYIDDETACEKHFSIVTVVLGLGNPKQIFFRSSFPGDGMAKHGSGSGRV